MNQRLQRLADQIQRELALLIRDEIKDPRLTGLITLSKVKVSPDLGYADIYVTIMEKDLSDPMGEANHAESLEILNKAAGFLRTELSHHLKTRTTPRLRFHYDETLAHGNHMMELIQQAVQKSQTTQSDTDEPTETAQPS